MRTKSLDFGSYRSVLGCCWGQISTLDNSFFRISLLLNHFDIPLSNVEI